MIFRRALMRELALNTAMTFCALLAIVFTSLIIRVLRDAAGGSVPIDAITGLLGFYALQQMPLVLSVSIFLSVLLTLSRSWRDSETVVWMSSGQSLAGWIRPVLQFAVPLLLLSGALSLVLTPWSIERRQQYQKILESRDELAAVTPGLFQEARKDKRIHFVEKFNVVDGNLENVFLNRDLPDRTETVVAKRGFLYEDKEGDKFLILEQGRRYVTSPDGDGEIDIVDFTRYGLRIDIPTVQAFSPEENAKDTITLLGAKTPLAGGELFWRFSMPIAGFIMIFAAIPLSYVNARLGRSYNLIFGVLLFYVYFKMMDIVQGQVRLGNIHWGLALFLLHGLALAAVLVMFYRRYQGATFWKYVQFWQRNENASPLPR
jgi:lipopolysaccharide export system permease protein